MASVCGAQFHFGGHDQVSPGQGGGASNLSLSSIADEHSTVAGAGGAGSGFDTITAPGASSDIPHAQGGSDVLATQGQEGGNTVVHLADGSSITVLGVTHIDASFFSH